MPGFTTTQCTKDMLPRMYFDRHCTMGDDDGGQTGFPPPKSIRAGRGHLHHRAWNGEEDGEESFSTGSLSGIHDPPRVFEGGYLGSIL